MGSRSASSNATTNTDNRVGADGDAIALGASSSFNYNDGVSDNEVAIFEQLAAVTQQALDKTGAAISTIEKTGEIALTAINERRTNEEQGSVTILKDIFPVAGIAVAAWAATQIFKRA